MSYTRRDFVNKACSELGVSTYTFDLPPERLEEMGDRLDAMMADWNARGIRLGYPLPSSPGNNDLDDDTNVPDMANRAVIANLAMECAGLFGKQPMVSTVRAAKSGLSSLLIHFAGPIERQMQRLPAGSGNKPWVFNDPFLIGPEPSLTAGPDSELEF